MAGSSMIPALKATIKVMTLVPFVVAVLAAPAYVANKYGRNEYAIDRYGRRLLGEEERDHPRKKT